MTTPRKGLLKIIAETIFGLEARAAASWASSAHRRLMQAQWALQPSPEWFDHQIDPYYQFQKERNSMWAERGTFGSLALKGGDVLELACGDGFNAKNFYSLRSRRVVACDFDPSAIATAKRKNSAPNVSYVLADIRTQMPEGTFDNVVWDAAIEHFTPEEIAGIMAAIKRRLSPAGVLSGYSIVERADGVKHIHQHEYEFADMDDLKRFLAPHFKNVKVFETVFPSRHNHILLGLGRDPSIRSGLGAYGRSARLEPISEAPTAAAGSPGDAAQGPGVDRGLQGFETRLASSRPPSIPSRQRCCPALILERHRQDQRSRHDDPHQRHRQCVMVRIRKEITPWPLIPESTIKRSRRNTGTGS